ncbi:MAG: hypothetical protein ABEK17_00235 [Candidatus Aenigmatarchaeota archaeon]
MIKSNFFVFIIILSTFLYGRDQTDPDRSEKYKSIQFEEITAKKKVSEEKLDQSWEQLIKLMQDENTSFEQKKLLVRNFRKTYPGEHKYSYSIKKIQRELNKKHDYNADLVYHLLHREKYRNEIEYLSFKVYFSPDRLMTSVVLPSILFNYFFVEPFQLNFITIFDPSSSNPMHLDSKYTDRKLFQAFSLSTQTGIRIYLTENNRNELRFSVGFGMGAPTTLFPKSGFMSFSEVSYLHHLYNHGSLQFGIYFSFLEFDIFEDEIVSSLFAGFRF